MSFTRRARFRRRIAAPGHVSVEIYGKLRIDESPRFAQGPVQSHLIVGLGGNLEIGRNLRMGTGSGVFCAAASSIGDDVLIGPFVLVMDSDFHVAGEPFKVSEPRPIRIGNRVAIGVWSVVLPGAEVGDDVIVAPGSVVSGRIASGSHVSGNPASAERRREISFDASAADLGALVVAAMSGLFGQQLEVSTWMEMVTGWDSLGAVRLLGVLEDEFPTCRVSEHEVLTAATVGDVVSAVRPRVVRES